jgi:hypothetical protein
MIISSRLASARIIKHLTYPVPVGRLERGKAQAPLPNKTAHGFIRGHELL